MTAAARRSPRAPFEDLESVARSYCRRFPVVFDKASGSTLWDESGFRYIDFLSGAGALNYGHNHPKIKSRLIDYLRSDGIVHSLDLHTPAKREFIEALETTVLAPRNLTYRVQFTGPSGTNAVESALKLARRATGRSEVVAFTHGFHGLSLGSLAATASGAKRRGAGVALDHVTRIPYDGFFGPQIDTVEYLRALLDDPGSGIELPAAIVVEAVQGEGGVRAARTGWLRDLEELARRRGIVLIIDDIQAGCGRTGRFFSFEIAGLSPDIVCLSKSISGYGLPMALVLVKPELDCLEPTEHGGTFRGNNLAFVGATAALDLWNDPSFESGIHQVADFLDSRLQDLARALPTLECEVRGRGFLRGLRFGDAALAADVSATAFELGLLCETSGARGDVVKIMPPIVIDKPTLADGLDRLEAAIRTAREKR